jgi:hypothetical protein
MGGIHLMSVEGAESSWTAAYYHVWALRCVPRHIILLSTNNPRFVLTQYHLISDWASAFCTGGTCERAAEMAKGVPKRVLSKA